MEEKPLKRHVTWDLFGAPERPETEDKINSKLKGNKNEAVITKWLLAWTGEKFSRVPRSGGMRWKNTANACGDVICEDTDFAFLFAVETKHYKTIDFTGVRADVKKFWRQAADDAERAKKLPLLAIRENDMPRQTWVVYFNFLLPATTPIYKVVVDNEKIYGYSSSYIIDNLPYSSLKMYVVEQNLLSLRK